MPERWTLRRLDEASDPTAPRSIAATTDRLRRRLKATTKGPRRLEYEGTLHHKRWPKVGPLGDRVDELMRRKGGPDRILVRPTSGPTWALKRVEIREHEPVPDGPGTPQIDRIRAATFAEFGPGSSYDWDLRDLGICADKDGEHGECNAWDVGVNPSLPATEQHRRLEMIAEFHMREGRKHLLSSGADGLPVNGTIVLERYWERGNDGWRPYGGTPHVSHVHTSGHPSRTGWV